MKNLRLMTCHWTLPIPDHKRNNTGLFFITGGAGSISSGGELYDVKEGDLLICFPLEDHGYFPEERGFLDALYITFEWAGDSDELKSDLEGLRGKRRIHLRPEDVALIEGLESLLSSDNLYCRREGDYRVKSLLYRLLSRETSAPVRPAPDLFDRIMECLYTDFNISLKELSRRFSLSEEAIRLLFKEKIGDTPMRYMTDYRIKLAAYRLKTTDMTLAELAEAFGFSDAYHFSRTFKRHMGVTPREYRITGSQYDIIKQQSRRFP